MNSSITISHLFHKNRLTYRAYGEKGNIMEKFTKRYVDVVVRMMTTKSEARKFLHRQLYEMKNEVTREHYFEMYEYITQATA